MDWERYRSSADGHRSQPIALMDLDGLKQTNDLLGHATGDALLIDVAGRLRKAVPAAARVFRLGGDEFLVAIPGLVDASYSRQALEDALAGFQVTWKQEGVQASVSIGFASCPSEGDDLVAAMSLADERMYQMKQANRTTPVSHC